MLLVPLLPLVHLLLRLPQVLLLLLRCPLGRVGSGRRLPASRGL